MIEGQQSCRANRLGFRYDPAVESVTMEPKKRLGSGLNRRERARRNLRLRQVD
jgi:hypothetical protein